jgi:hypothetical protein
VRAAGRADSINAPLAASMRDVETTLLVAAFPLGDTAPGQVSGFSRVFACLGRDSGMAGLNSFMHALY